MRPDAPDPASYFTLQNQSELRQVQELPQKGNSFPDHSDETSTSEMEAQQREGEGKEEFEMR